MGATTSRESSDEEQERKRCLGITASSTHLEGIAVSKLAESYYNSAKTSPVSNHSCESPTISPRESPLPNGIDCSVENPSTSIKSSPPCTLSTLTRRERDAWAQLKSCLPRQNQNDRLEPGQSGHQRSEGCQRQLPSFFPIGGKNYSNTLNISRDFSQQNKPVPIQKSSSTTNQFEIKSEEVKTYYSPTIIASMR